MRGEGGRIGSKVLTWEDSGKVPAQRGPSGGGAVRSMGGRGDGRKREGDNAVREEEEEEEEVEEEEEEEEVGREGERRGTVVYTATMGPRR